jgi:hypothetical protein
MRASSRADSVAKRRGRTSSGAAAWRSVVQCICTHAPSQRTQVVGDVAELPDHLGITENSGGRITGAAECDCTCLTQYFAQAFRTPYRGCGALAL